MSCEKGKMPNKIEAGFFRGDLIAYKEALYNVFVRDFVDNELVYNNKPVDIIHEKYFEGKERSFWHIISEGAEDEGRVPISWRAEALPWARALIEEDGDCQEYKHWVKYHDKTKSDRHYIWCVAINYMVILEDRGTHYKLITAYPVQEYKVKSYMKDYQKYK